ncbi:DNA polymerase III subunit delta' [Salinivibrio sp. ES.052]|uniref:DNA polymerase III subunit delta' n=1 Tax=Salinivibrio sp. ES.052 TaxID=1882823 RepID=UPI0009259D7A|nr:DNA polymerase III subunit delta' [Salinivibrio sp. ES.052]SIN80644.1 DNA polymerase III, delta prime subunit [Salinivibrio sp. ES.052]
MNESAIANHQAPFVFPWFEPVWAHWQQLLSSARFPHAVLLSAPPGSGRRAMASQLAKVRLCKSQTDNACGHCHSCQLFDAGNHPDLHWLAPEKTGKQIGIDAIRKVQRQAIETSQLGGARFIVIERVESLGEAAANALLKSLEEPPAGCYFVLLTDSLDSLLATIISRCSVWKAPQPDGESAKYWIEQALKCSVPDHAVGLFRGAPLAARDFVASGGLEHHHAVINGFTTYVKTHVGLFDTLAVLTSHYPASLDWLSYFLLDVLKWRQGAQHAIVHSYHHQQVADVANLMGTQQTHMALRQLHQLQRQLQTHTGLNTELVLSQWLLSIGE